ncbi:hypothetical protein GGF32_009846 [Allomyces javanicus]|nr:hypothetical protein GGF32_009846 [Allomyces javanicus]
MMRATALIHALVTMLAAVAVVSTMPHRALASPVPDGADFAETPNLVGIDGHGTAGVDAAADGTSWWSLNDDRLHCSACYNEGLAEKICKNKCKKDAGRLYCDECGYHRKSGRKLWCR